MTALPQRIVVASRRRKPKLTSLREEAIVEAEADFIYTPVSDTTRATEINRLAAEQGADLIVLRARTRSTWERVWSAVAGENSLPATLSHDAPCPVLVVDENSDADARWLVPTDLSDASELAMNSIGALAEAAGAAVTLFHVFTPQPAQPVLWPTPYAIARVELLSISELLRERLEAIRQVHFRGVADVSCEVVPGVLPTSALLDRASRPDIGTIAVASSPRNALQTLWGDDVDALLNEGVCSTLVVPESVYA